MEFEEIYTEDTKKLVTSLCLRMLENPDDAEDVSQDTFIKVWQKLGTFRGESDIRTWIFQIARRQCLSFIQRRCPLEVFYLSEEVPGTGKAVTWAEILPARGVSPENRIFLREVLTQLYSMAPMYLKPLMLQIQGYSENEIGSMLGALSAACIKTRIFRARRQMVEHFA